MPVVFGPQDVAALVAAFPPQSHGTRPSLVRTSTGDSLIDFDRVDQQFQTLVRDSISRISQQNLSSMLNIEPSAVSVLLHHSSAQLCFSKDGQYILPHTEIIDISGQLAKAAASNFVECVGFSQGVDVEFGALLRLLAAHEYHAWKQFPRRQDYYVCDGRFFEQTISKITSYIDSNDTEIVDLTALVADIPSSILEEVVDERIKSADGALRIDGEQVVFVPNSHRAAPLDGPSEIRAKQVAVFIRELDQRSYCVVPVGRESDAALEQDDLVRSVLSEYERLRSNDPPLSVVECVTESSNKASRRHDPVTQSSLLVTSETLSHHVNEVKRSIVADAEKIWQDSEKRISPTDLVLAVQQHHATSSEADSSLVKLLVRTTYMKEFEELARGQISFQEEKDQNALAGLVNDRLVAPMQLYVAAIATIVDPTLKQNLQAFVLEYFRLHFAGSIGREVSVRELLSDKHKSREFDKFQQAHQQAKTLEDLQVSVNRLTKKLKIPNPTPELLGTVKKSFLKGALKSEFRQSVVASVLLQNTIWILLAQKSEGIFISAGKDTSRMIKQYQAVGDKETAQKLLHWRDLAKAGHVDEDVLAAMRYTAKAALQNMYGESEVP